MFTSETYSTVCICLINMPQFPITGKQYKKKMMEDRYNYYDFVKSRCFFKHSNCTLTFTSPCRNEILYATTLPASCKTSWSLLLLLLLIQSCCKSSARECCLCIPFWDNTRFSSGRSKRGIKFLQSSWIVHRPGKRKKRFLLFLNEPHLRPFFLVGNHNSNSVICHLDKDLHYFLVQPCRDI